jgi:uncharacterized cupredoxin-like copper-binding protein
MKKLAVLIGMVMVASLVLAACGGGSPSDSGGGSNSIDVTLADFSFTPKDWTVPANTSITLNIKNNGSVAHTWVLLNKAITPPYSNADQSDVVFASPQIQPGKSQTVTFTSPATPGTYEVICDLPGHLEAGMEGTLTVK